ncbi:cysteine hydrolase family protein [Glaciimonas sp. PCH181]|uniref:cysteine hydrolase family protein n=1 Tax=Glaciimonas sp. PCH181 TaxID=2133943 RepID=UPI000D3934C7|nr:cysteine hydrolase family protein [Glaciimonas sp. PCH181]PUA18751.1 cysteine hydrolase [Glaciimonas sp. PCH181]
MASALLVIDVQEGLFRPEPRPALADAIVMRINDLTSRAREHDIPVCFVQHETNSGELEFGSAAWALVKQLKVEATDNLVRKTTGDAFLRTSLSALLETLSVSHLFVCGYATEFCVDTTVRRAAALGYDVTLVADAHTTHDKAHASAAQIREHHNYTLPEITSFGSRILALSSDRLNFPSN